MTHDVDLSSAVTYVPAVLLLLWTTAVAGVSCLTSTEQGSPVLVIMVYTANWLLQGVAVRLWRVLPRGVSVWLAWVAYGDLMMARQPVHSLVMRMAVSLGMVGCGFAAALIFPRDDRSQMVPLAVVVLVLTFLAMFPGPTACFSQLSCTDRVVKTAVFSLLFGFLHIFLPPSDKLELAHTQRVTIASGWVLFVGKYEGLIGTPWMVLLVLHQTGNLGILRELRLGSPRGAPPDAEDPLAGSGSSTPSPDAHSVTPAALSQMAGMRSRPFEAQPDVARLQALAAGRPL